MSVFYALKNTCQEMGRVFCKNLSRGSRLRHKSVFAAFFRQHEDFEPPAGCVGRGHSGPKMPPRRPGRKSTRPPGDEPLESGAGTQRAACPMRGRQERRVTRGAGKGGWSGGHQENVPGSLTTGADMGEEIISPPPSQHGAGEPHGSQAGVAQGAQAGGPQGAICGWGCCRRLRQPPP